MTPDDAFVGLFILLGICVVLLALYMVAELAVIAWALRMLFKHSPKASSQGEESAP